jgi:hypothetical protein
MSTDFGHETQLSPVAKPVSKQSSANVACIDVENQLQFSFHCTNRYADVAYRRLKLLEHVVVVHAHAWKLVESTTVAFIASETRI